MRVFEVDHPASQEAKRAALAAAGIPVPGNVTFVPADLRRTLSASAWPAPGFDAAAPAVFGWLGVTMYLTADAVAETMTAVAGCAPGSELIADYLLPEDARDEAGALYGRLVAQASAERGEPWRSCFTPPEIADLARAVRPRRRCALSASVTPSPLTCGGAPTRCARLTWRSCSTAWSPAADRMATLCCLRRAMRSPRWPPAR